MLRISTANPSQAPKELAALRAELLALDQRCFARPWSAEAWALELERSFCRVLTLSQADQLQGYCVVWVLAPQAELLRIAVCKAGRGQGWGAQLLAAGIEAARAAGCTQMSLEVQADNHAAIALYEKAGFASVARRAGYYAGVDALVMQAEL